MSVQGDGRKFLMAGLGTTLSKISRFEIHLFSEDIVFLAKGTVNRNCPELGKLFKICCDKLILESGLILGVLYLSNYTFFLGRAQIRN